MANKKINQLVSKTAILSTDIFGIGDATTGQLFKKTIAELQAAIGGAVISVNGLVGTVVLDTDDIQELASPTNKYFTDARARGAISLTVTGNSGASTYSSGTGVLNVPTYTLAGLGGITASFLSGTSGISYNSGTGVISYSGTVYTDSSIRALLSGSTGITYNSSTGAISYSGTVYTDSSVRALISMTTTGNSGASTYNNTTGVINVPDYTLAGLGGISLTSLSGGTGITYNNTTGAISYSGTVYTDASVRALISASGAVSYNNTTGVISLTSGNLTEATSSVLTITGGTGAVLGSGTSIQVSQASTSVSGFLSSTDWTTFNNKANALSGTTNYVAKFTSSTGIGNSQIFDNGTNVGIGTLAPADFIDATSGVAIIASSGRAGLSLGSTQGTADEVLSRLSFTNTNSTNAGGKRLAYISGIRGTTNNSAYLEFGTANDGLGAQRMVISQTGNLGVGTSSPSTKLHVYEALTNASAYLTVQNNRARNAGVYCVTSNGGFYAGTSIGTDTFNYQIYDGVAGAARLTIAANGEATFSNKVAATSYNVTADSGFRGGIFPYKTVSGSGVDMGITIFAEGGTNNGNIYFLVNGSTTKAVTITTTSNMLIGTTSDNGERLYVSGNIRATGTITANSDITLKKNLLKIENALEKVEQINGYTYEFKEDDSKRHAGVIAQEIQTVLPEIVNKGNDGILGVQYGNISALLIEAIKEQQTQINELKALLNK